MHDRMCDLFEPCTSPEAPLCPLQESSIKHGLWYADEPICRAKKFQTSPWIKKQKRIARLGLTTDDGFFTVRMLNSIRETAITRNLKGADPDDSDSESKWLGQRAEKRATASQARRSKKASKREDLATLPLLKALAEVGAGSP